MSSRADLEGQVNNSYACQNSWLINGLLKDEFGFQGFVVSDWLAQKNGVESVLAGMYVDHSFSTFIESHLSWGDLDPMDDSCFFLF